MFEYNKLPGLDLHCRSTVAVDARMQVGEAIAYERQNMARHMAEAIVHEDKFFRTVELHGGILLEIRADCRVMTLKELRDALAEAFAQGVEHGRGRGYRPFQA